MGRLPVRFEADDTGRVRVDILAGQENGAAGESDFECVERGVGFSCLRGRTVDNWALRRLAAIWRR